MVLGGAAPGGEGGAGVWWGEAGGWWIGCKGSLNPQPLWGQLCVSGGGWVGGW
jgi:hypothetical protein